MTPARSAIPSQFQTLALSMCVFHPLPALPCQYQRSRSPSNPCRVRIDIHPLLVSLVPPPYETSPQFYRRPSSCPNPVSTTSPYPFRPQRSSAARGQQPRSAPCCSLSHFSRTLRSRIRRASRPTRDGRRAYCPPRALPWALYPSSSSKTPAW